MALTRCRDVMVRLLAAYGSQYDTMRDYTFDGRFFPAFAEFHSHGESYVLVKRAKMWEVNTHEFIFIDIMEALGEAELTELVDFVIAKGFRKVPADKNHMSSAVSLIIITEHVSDDAIKLIRKSKHRKTYKMGLHGWADMRLAVVDLSRPKGKRVFTNAAGKPLANALKANSNLVLEKQERSQN